MGTCPSACGACSMESRRQRTWTHLGQGFFMSGGCLHAGTNDKRNLIPPCPLPNSALLSPRSRRACLNTLDRTARGRGRARRALTDHIPRGQLPCPASHSGGGVLGQAVGKLLSSPRLGAIEHDDVPALEMAGHTGSVRAKSHRLHWRLKVTTGAGGSLRAPSFFPPSGPF